MVWFDPKCRDKIGAAATTLLPPLITMLVTGEKLGGIVFLILSFLISPLGIPVIAEWLNARLDDLNYSLRNYITS